MGVERRVEDGGSCREKEGGRKLGEEQSIVAKLREGLSGLEPMATLADRNAHDCTRRAFLRFLFVRGVGPRSSSKRKRRSVSWWRDMNGIAVGI